MCEVAAACWPSQCAHTQGRVLQANLTQAWLQREVNAWHSSVCIGSVRAREVWGGRSVLQQHFGAAAWHRQKSSARSSHQALWCRRSREVNPILVGSARSSHAGRSTVWLGGGKGLQKTWTKLCLGQPSSRPAWELGCLLACLACNSDRAMSEGAKRANAKIFYLQQSPKIKEH